MEADEIIDDEMQEDENGPFPLQRLFQTKEW